jgi:hypothetical protein
MAHNVRGDEERAEADSSALAKAYELIGSGVRGKLDLEMLEANGWTIQRSGPALLFVRDDLIFAVLTASPAAEVPMVRAAGLVSEYLASPPSRFDTRTMSEAERVALEEVGANFEDDDVVEIVRAASEAAYEELLSRCVIGDAELAKLLAVHPTRISQRVAERSLYSFVDTNDQRCYPKWQFIHGKVVAGLKAVLKPMDPDVHPLTADRWFTRPDVDLLVDGVEVSPIEWLRSGGAPAKVADHIRFL